MDTQAGLERRENNAARSEGNGARTAQPIRYFKPNVDILENNEELLLYADVPGTRPEDIHLEFNQGKLTVHAMVSKRQPDDTRYLFREYGIGDFYRSFDVMEGIDVDNIRAEYNAGVLTLHLPKAQAARARKISVTTPTQ